jgi:hypothetical protein
MVMTVRRSSFSPLAFFLWLVFGSRVDLVRSHDYFSPARILAEDKLVKELVDDGAFICQIKAFCERP